MRILGDSKEVLSLKTKINFLSKQVDSAKEKYSKAYEALKNEREHSALLSAEVASLSAKLERAKLAVIQSRKRQKASVERANRYKASLALRLN
jgi:outer membrane murein-binding lipoprotein Lpp